MNRRELLRNGIGAATVLFAGCSSADGPHNPPNDSTDERGGLESEVTYDYERENFYLSASYISRNAPDEVGVTARVINQNFEGATIPVSFKAVDGDGVVVFSEPVVGVGIDGGTASVATSWFDATEEEFEMDLYPQIRFRSEPP